MDAPAWLTDEVVNEGRFAAWEAHATEPDVFKCWRIGFLLILAHQPAPEPQRKPTFPVETRVRHDVGIGIVLSTGWIEPNMMETSGSDPEICTWLRDDGKLCVSSACYLRPIPPPPTMADREREHGPVLKRAMRICESIPYPYRLGANAMMQSLYQVECDWTDHGCEWTVLASPGDVA